MSIKLEEQQAVVRELEQHLLPKVRAEGSTPLVTAFLYPDRYRIQQWDITKKEELLTTARMMGTLARKKGVQELIVVGTAVLLKDLPEDSCITKTMAIMYTCISLLDNYSRQFFRPYRLVGDSIIFDSDEPLSLQSKPLTDLVPAIMDGYMEEPSE